MTTELDIIIDSILKGIQAIAHIIVQIPSYVTWLTTTLFYIFPNWFTTVFGVCIAIIVGKWIFKR